MTMILGNEIGRLDAYGSTAPATAQIPMYDTATGEASTLTVTEIVSAVEVAGPASSTDNAIARFDSTTGKIIQNSATTVSDTSGSIVFSSVAGGIVLKQGSNARCGTFVANGSTPVTVSNTSIAVTDAIIISLNTVGGTVGVQPHVATITASTGFTVVCTASDTSTYNYALIGNAA